jgi:hypothetical protein
MIKRQKEFKSMKFMFITHFGAFGLNMFLAFKIVNFENVSSIEVIHF